MKRLTLLSLLFLSFSFCFANEKEKLPEIPWANIVEMDLSFGRIQLWNSNIKIELVGAYTAEDSLVVAKVVNQLDSLTESISISFSQRDRGNFEIFFIDSINAKFEGYYMGFPYNKENHTKYIPNSQGIGDSEGQTYLRIYILKDKIDSAKYQFVVRNKIAAGLISASLSNRADMKIAKNRNSIFNPIQYMDNGIDAYQQEMNALDMAIIKETYKKDYKRNIEIAKNQFKPVIPWWVKVDPFSFLLLPLGVLLIVITFISIRLFNWISGKINHHLLSFNLKIVFVLVVLSFLFSSYLFLAKHWLVFHYDALYLREYTKMLSVISVISFFILLPGVNLIAHVEKIIQRLEGKRYLKLLLVFTTTSLIPYIILLIFLIFMSEINNQTPYLNKDTVSVLTKIFIGFFVLAGFRVIISYFAAKEKDLIIENETKLSNLRELKSRAELNALHSRINPHFLYNSLNSIAGLAHEDADKTEHMALSLSKLFRYSINKDQSDWTTFKEEMEMVKIYLDVEKVRFDDRLSYSVELPKVLEDYKIPRFMIQPLVENAVKHGISKSVNSGQIKVAVTQEGKRLFIAVSDDGPAFPNDLAPGFGIQSIYDKLEILYKDKFEMNFINSPQKQVLIKLN